MSVNKPLPATPDVATKEPLDMLPAQLSATCGKQLQYDEHELSKRLSVALFANKSAFTRPPQVNHLLSPEDKPCGLAALDNDAKPPERNETGSQKPALRHPPVALSYYNSRLTPIQKKEVLPTSYHGVYQGVPLVDEVIPVTWKPWETDDNNRTASTAVDRPALTPVSATPAATTPTVKASDKAVETAAIAAKRSNQESKPPRQKASAARAQSSASSRSRKRSSVAPGTQPTRRPLTSTQEAHAKHYTEWRDIHVQSLSRVDSILREAVGLRAANPSRLSACASPLQGSEDLVAPPHSGLGITVSQSTSLPHTREASSRPRTAAANQGMYSLSASNASTSAFGSRGDSAHASPRPNTSSSYLPTPVSKPSLLDSYRHSEVSTAQSTGDAGSARPMRSHTASSLDSPHADARGASMYLSNQAPRPATTHGNRRQMSMYNPSMRQLRLSRDEARRSRLFAEYELLMGGKESGEENDDDDDDDNDEDDVATVDEIDDDAVLVGIPMEHGQGSLDDISEEAEYEFANYEPSPVDDIVLSGPHNEEKAAAPQQTSLVDKRKPIYAARPRPATVFGLAGPTLREARNNQAISMYSSVDILSRKQTEKRWSRTLIQNQHLFRAQTIADQLDLESVFGDGEDIDEDASSHEASPPPQPLQLDLPPDVDLYQDVTQALAERMPPLSARSTTSTLSAATMAMRSEHAMSVAFPLTGSQFLSLQADAAFGMPTFTDKSSSRRPANGKGTASDDSATATAKSSPHGSAAEKSKKRESIYINSEDLFDSALLAEAELPYQQEQGTPTGTMQTPSAEEYTPTIAASSLPGSEKLHINFDAEAVTELDIDALTTRDIVDEEGEFTARAAALDFGTRDNVVSAPLSAPATSSWADRPSTVSGDSRPSATKSSTAECLSETARPKLGTRHSEIIRQQLRYVEGHTPATKLGSELSKSDDEHRQMLDAYMKRFDFCDQPVDFALRQLFQEFHLPAESQQIDRVITSFAGRYHMCNPGLFYSADIVYAYSFAILLLHTDAHNPKVKHKISKAQFVARAKLLDEHEPGQDNEMFDEILDILYDNITMVKFEYAPSSMLGGQPFATPAVRRPATSQGIGAHQYHTSAATANVAADHARDQSPGISGWLRRVFAPASSASVHTKSPLSPQDIPSKEQYSYSSLPRRRFAPVGLGPVSPIVDVSSSQLPPTPTISRPNTSHGTISRNSNSEFSMRGAERDSVDNYEYDGDLFASSMSSLRLRANTVAPSVNIPEISPLATDFALTYSSPILSEVGGEGEDGDILLGRVSSSAFYTAPSDSGTTTAQDTPRPSTARPFRSSPLAVNIGASQGRLTHIPSSPESDGGSSGVLSPPGSPRGPHLGLSLSTSFATSDVAASAQPLIVETIRLSGVKSHVKRRISLRQGRPLSGIIYQKPSPPPQRQQHDIHSHAVIGCAATAGSSISAAVVAAATASASSALLRVDMSGRVSRKMERLDNGRRGLVRRWKDIWMVLSGSRLYFFRSNDGAQSEAQQQHLVNSAGGPDTGSQQSLASGGSGRPAMSIQTIVPLREGVAIVDAAYKKYPHVFRILAGDGSQVLIKAPNDDAVAEWMARINCAAAFKTMEIERRTADASSAATSQQTEAQRSEQRAQLLETKLATLDEDLNAIDDRLERSLRLFKQLVAMVPLTRQGRTRTVQYASAARERLKELYMSEQRLTCYKDVLELDLAIEYELGGHIAFGAQE
ncbi:hypothetical protein GGH94_003649 [Coemansia aciculifera]|uniref:SEC7 domain-containing protein n=2 Tax=Coemansia TaxID=4863 RepID=A0A9W8M4A7_9FUNG|nr:hypothetical protein GGH94_003649 [Coemansia aciculifera]